MIFGDDFAGINKWREILKGKKKILKIVKSTAPILVGEMEETSS